MRPARFNSEPVLNLFNHITKENLVISNQGSKYTYIQGDRKSVIDITVSTQKIAEHIVEWEVHEEESFADHRLITYRISGNRVEKVVTRNRKKTDWIKVNKILETESKTLENRIRTKEELEKTAEEFQQNLLNAHAKSCRTIKNKTKGYTEWFSDKLKEDREEVRKLYRKIDRDISLKKQKKLVDKYDKAKKEYRKACRAARLTSWRKKTEQLESTKDIARMQKLMENKKPPGVSTIRKEDGTYTNTRQETLEVLMKTHFPDCERIKENEEINTEENIETVNEEEIKNIENMISMAKVHWALENFGP